MSYRKWIKGTIPSICKILTILINRPLGCSYIGVPTGGCLISLNKDSSLSINSNASCSSSLTRRSYRCRDDDVWDITKLNSSHTSKCMPTDNHFYSVNSSIHVFHSTLVYLLHFVSKCPWSETVHFIFTCAQYCELNSPSQWPSVWSANSNQLVLSVDFSKRIFADCQHSRTSKVNMPCVFDREWREPIILHKYGLRFAKNVI